MKLVDLTWSRYSVPFRAAFHTAHGTLSQRTGALVAAHTDAGLIGYGEIAPLPAHHGLDLEQVLKALPALADSLRGRPLPAILRFLAAQSADEQLPAPLICGLETALLDACGQANRVRVADLLAGDYPADETPAPATLPACVAVNAVIGGATIAATIASAQTACTAGFTCLKLKLIGNPPADLERVAAVRAAIGPVPRLRLDANASWPGAEMTRTLLARYARYDIEYIEQPLAPADLAGMASLRRVSPIPLAVDEALTGPASARHVLQAGAADVLILKPQLAGGLRACRQMIQEASAQGVACVITSTLETGIGVTAALHLAAASPAITLPCGLATLALLENDLLQTGLSIHQGKLALPSAPGLGVLPDQAACRRFSAEATQ